MLEMYKMYDFYNTWMYIAPLYIFCTYKFLPFLYADSFQNVAIVISCFHSFPLGWYLQEGIVIKVHLSIKARVCVHCIIAAHLVYQGVCVCVCSVILLCITDSSYCLIAIW